MKLLTLKFILIFIYLISSSSSYAIQQPNLKNLIVHKDPKKLEKINFININKKKIINNAKKLGVKKIIINDLKNIFVKEYVFPMIRGHAVYEGVYLLGTSIARPLIAKRQIQIAKKFKAYAVSHGSTGKGNDQVRFELCYHYFGPKIKIITPWRIWKLNSRSDLIKYAKKNNIPIPKNKKGTYVQPPSTLPVRKLWK